MPVATLPWVPDLQHRRLPDFFSFEERRTRDYGALHQLLEGDRVIVSSEAAAADLRRFYGPAASRLSVLRFVSQPRMAVDELPTLADLRQRWELPERYFFLPNQFWRHKNHAVVLQALVLATKRGVELSVVATGKGEDYRAPGHYRELMQQVADAGLERQFRHLGMVSYPDLQGLMRDAIAVVNPSLFEGWSTTVEEARSLGKATVLSDIDVHREQSPPGSHFFPAADTNALADVLIDLWLQRSADDDARRLAASAALSARTFEFARTYQRIVGDAIERRSHR